MNKELSVIPDSKELVRQSTDIAGLCRDIVVASSLVIEKRKYVRVEGWQAIATAHGCVASARDVRKVEGGMIATGEIRRMQDGGLIATAEGFVGEDEPTWYGGILEKDEWTGPSGNRKKTGKKITVTLPKRAEYAIRAMAQTRAISRACRGCFAHVVVLMNAGLSTTPAEEVPEGGFRDEPDTSHGEPESTPPEPAVVLTEEEAWKKNIAKARDAITKNCSPHDATEFEKYTCMLVSKKLTPDVNPRESLEAFTLLEYRNGFLKQLAVAMSEVHKMHAAATGGAK